MPVLLILEAEALSVGRREKIAQNESETECKYKKEFKCVEAEDRM